MARYTYGGRLEQVGVEVAADLTLKLKPNDFLPPLYDKPADDVTRVVVTDFLIDGSAASTIPTDDTGIPVYFEGPDNIRPLFDEAGHRLNPNDNLGDTVVPAATEAVAGISEISSNAEADTGVDNITQMSPAKVKRRLDAHNADPSSHSDLRTVVDQTATVLGDKADLISGTVPLDQLPAADGATPDTLLLRRATGGAPVGTAALDDEAVPFLQAQNMIAAGAGSGADVRSLDASSLPLSVTSNATTYTAIPGIIVTDAETGQVWECYYCLTYRASTAGGIKVRHKLGAAAVTNQLANPSFDTNTANWSISNPHTLTRDTSVTSQDGTGHGKAVAASTLTMQIRTEWHPATPGQIWSAGAYGRLSVGTAKNFRADVEYGDAAGAVVRTFLGAPIVPGSGAWTRSVATGDTVGAPSTATQARTRVSYVTPAVADVVFFDAVQLEQAATLPAYGSTGGSGANALDISGFWAGMKKAGTTVEDYGRKEVARYPTITPYVPAEFGAVTSPGAADTVVEGSFKVAVGGTALVGQRIELEFCQQASSATATQILAASATLARVV